MRDKQQTIVRAKRALAGYPDHSDDEARVAELLADLRHYADASGVDFAKALELGSIYYEGEVSRD